MYVSALDSLQLVDKFLGVIDLKTGSLIIAAIGVIHPTAYGCTLFMPMSYLLVTVWILVSLFFATSFMLFFGVVKDDPVLCEIWVWYSLAFVSIMLLLLLLMMVTFVVRSQSSRVFLTIFAMLWYILTVYFIIVVNSHRKNLFETMNNATMKTDEQIKDD